jgi:molybdopterin-binding protein
MQASGDLMKISARNSSLKKGPVDTEIIPALDGGAEIVSVITTNSAENLDLKESGKVFAIMKASEMMVGFD